MTRLQHMGKYLNAASGSCHRRLGGLLFAVFLLAAQMLYAGEEENLRARVAMELFPSVLAADTGIQGKQDANGRLHVLVVYDHQKNLAGDIARYFRQIGHVKDIPLQIAEIRPEDLKQKKGPAAGIFMAEPLPAQLPGILKFGREHNALVFSPFEGDVERGAPAGMAIGARISPYVNMDALQQSGIRLKPFFLKISKQYGHQ